jgi:hypothetical protein
LELVEPVASSLVAAEQRHLDTLQPCFNILPKAGSRLGGKHSKETHAKLRHIQNNRSPEHVENNRKHLAALLENAEVRQKWREVARNRIYSPKTREKMRQSFKRTPEQMAKIWQAAQTPEALEKRRQTMATPEFKEKFTAAQRARSPESRENFLKVSRNKSPEHREKLRQASLAAWSRPEIKEKMQEAFMLREERKQKARLNAKSVC